MGCSREQSLCNRIGFFFFLSIYLYISFSQLSIHVIIYLFTSWSIDLFIYLLIYLFFYTHLPIHRFIFFIPILNQCSRYIYNIFSHSICTVVFFGRALLSWTPGLGEWTTTPCVTTSYKSSLLKSLLNPFTPKSDLIDFTLANARRFYSV